MLVLKVPLVHLEKRYIQCMQVVIVCGKATLHIMRMIQMVAAPYVPSHRIVPNILMH